MTSQRNTPATNQPSLFVLLGAAGDLARRLVASALFELHRRGDLPERFVMLGLDLKLNVKEPGAYFTLAPADMRFSYQRAFHTPVPAAYETLLYGVLAGDQSLFVRADQIEAAWTLLQPAPDAWQRHPAVDFPNYAAGSWGPETAEGLISRDGRSWLVPTLQEADT